MNRVKLRGILNAGRGFFLLAGLAALCIGGRRVAAQELFPGITYRVGQAPDAVAAADVDGDGKFDIVTASTDANMVSVVRSLDSGNFAVKVDYQEIYDLPVHVASIDDLIATKRAANRPKDQNHIMELLALRKLIQEQGGTS